MEQNKILNKLLKLDENKYCADCRRPSPNWASINIGAFLCIKCSGFHRQLGTNISRIKSITLDVWPQFLLNNFQQISKYNL